MSDTCRPMRALAMGEDLGMEVHGLKHGVGVEQGRVARDLGWRSSGSGRGGGHSEKGRDV